MHSRIIRLKRKACQIGAVLMTLAVSTGFAPAGHAASEAVVDLTSQRAVEENLKENRKATYLYTKLEHPNNGWNTTYGLFNVASPVDTPSPGYLIWKVRLGAGRTLSLQMDFKAWAGVGNGGVLANGNSKLQYFYTTDMNAKTDGSTAGWKRFAEDTDWSLNTYAYTLTVPETFSEDKEIYILLRCNSTGDGAWIDRIVFTAESDEAVPLTAISLDRTDLTLPFGSEYRFRVTYFPATTSERELRWKSENPNVATVSENGVVIARGEGETLVTAYGGDGNLRAQCRITVPAGSEKIIRLSEDTVNADIRNTATDPYRIPNTWYYSCGDSDTSTSVVHWGQTVFRDFGYHAEIVYKLLVPADKSADLHLSMVINYRDANGTWDGVVGFGSESTSPRLNLFVCDGEVSIDCIRDADWKRIDSDGDWSGTVSDYTFHVADRGDADRYVYVRLYSTHVSSQGAWIKSLTFTPYVPVAEEIGIKAPSCVSYAEGSLPDLTGLAVGLRYNDSSTRFLTEDEYTVTPNRPLTAEDRVLTVTSAEGGFTAQIPITVYNREAVFPTDGAPCETEPKRKILPLTIVTGGCLLLLSGGCIAFSRRKSDKRRNKENEN